MATCSTLSIQKSYKYDVFLSFRGEDTRKKFVDHLYFALQRQGVHTYKDDERLEEGKRINDELLKSIEESKFYIIVFSKNYASSSWCLDELVKIMECQKATLQIAYPVFYDVDPSEIRKQLGSVAEAFARHKNKEKIWKWREALEEAANLVGWDLRNTADGHEAKVVNKIVEKISLELRFISSNVDENLIGMESRIKDIMSSLETGVEDVGMIGIKGIGGGGKTTLARAIFDKISFQFEGKCFVENVREVSKTSLFGLRLLQEQILCNLLNDKTITLRSVHEGKSIMKKMLCGKKVLLVLDDVDHLDQLDALAGGINWFKPGSRVIITTRDEQVLIAHRVNSVHDVSLLSDEEAICLFSRYAFGRDIPIQTYKALSLEVVHYAAGLPLTIRVLGSFLCGKNELEWEDALERLKRIPLKETLEKLELSYTGLEDDYKEIFIDVACLLKGWMIDDAIRALESCGFHAKNGLRVLEQKSLITISRDKVLSMHDHIEEMGRNIVRCSHPDEPIRHSRLWIQKEIEDVLAHDLVPEATRALTINTFSWHGKENICFGNMKKLRFLRVVCENDTLYEVGREFPNALRYLNWQFYPRCCLPESFQANNLVALEMSYSRIKQLWGDGEAKVLNNLRFLDLSYSDLMTLDCGLFPNLETLNLEYCCCLVELHVPFGCLRKLVYLDLNRCWGFKSLSFIKHLESLQGAKSKNCHRQLEIFKNLFL
ncbi:TMV resistance protein N isoform X2 [Lactuca sativa]|uniref:TMV resistance protein N isoform X2 n=1 Tax=Lactuca sativa TaxID=4236 RepID=UPI000CD8D757|nr:TMV resistance protein N isoform X2 [Lactuca sativa]